MKILYITHPAEDYLSDSILIGLKRQKGLEVIDFPVNRFIYRNDKFAENAHKLYGNGFTLYNVVDPDTKPNDAFHPMNFESFDFFIFSSIQRQTHWYLLLRPYLTVYNTLMFDGEDSGRLIGGLWNYFRKPGIWFLQNTYKKYLYFKREITSDTNFYRYLKLLPRFISNFLPLPTKLQPISFSIPSEKIIKEFPDKVKDFPVHIVDPEVQQNIPYASLKYAFANEDEYYKDLQSSRFGITTKRAGWDCMRHYEIAANGAVICFRGLDNKPILCAPHGLISGVNCISYSNYADLNNKLQNMTDAEYKKLQMASLKWVKQNTCEVIASKIIKEFILKINNPSA